VALALETAWNEALRAVMAPQEYYERQGVAERSRVDQE